MHTNQLSGDVRLTLSQKTRWIVGNFLTGIAGYGSGRSAKFWHPRTVATSDASPSRKMIDAFLDETVPHLFPQKDISVFDIGCGTGYIYKRLSALGYHLEYTGLDVYKRTAFDVNVPRGRFVLSKIEEFKADQRFDLVISNTCLEHVEDDHAAVEKALTLGDTQLPILPTFWSLPLYLWHGYRQYTPRSLQALFGSRGEIYRLGGVFSFFAHFIFVTVPQRLRVPLLFRKYGWYSYVCRAANALDAVLPWMSVMYVVVIQQNQPHDSVN